MIIRIIVISVVAIALGLMGFSSRSSPQVTSELPVLINPYLVRDDLPDLSAETDIKKKKTMFFSALLPLVQAENEHTLSLRDALLTIQSDLAGEQETVKETSLWLSHLAGRYRVNGCLNNELLCVDKLLSRVDIIPPSLVLAQAANESAWGTSRFAVEGNNIFGQWCFKKGCGLVPVSREGEAIHEVKTFDWIHHSVRAYMLNLNTHRSYKKFREIRAAKRQANDSILGVDLAYGLLSYSQRGHAYIEEIVNMIHFNEMEKFDS